VKYVLNKRPFLVPPLSFMARKHPPMLMVCASIHHASGVAAEDGSFRPGATITATATR
jgi:hypothetical protein